MNASIPGDKIKLAVHDTEEGRDKKRNITNENRKANYAKKATAAAAVATAPTSNSANDLNGGNPMQYDDYEDLPINKDARNYQARLTLSSFTSNDFPFIPFRSIFYISIAYHRKE